MHHHAFRVNVADVQIHGSLESQPELCWTTRPPSLHPPYWSAAVASRKNGDRARGAAVNDLMDLLDGQHSGNDYTFWDFSPVAKRYNFPIQ